MNSKGSLVLHCALEYNWFQWIRRYPLLFSLCTKIKWISMNLNDSLVFCCALKYIEVQWIWTVPLCSAGHPDIMNFNEFELVPYFLPGTRIQGISMNLDGSVVLRWAIGYKEFQWNLQGSLVLCCAFGNNELQWIWNVPCVRLGIGTQGPSMNLNGSLVFCWEIAYNEF